MEATYILPIRHIQLEEGLDELTDYLNWLASQVEVIVVDGSPPALFAIHHTRWSSSVIHIPPDTEGQITNGKVRGVLTGVRHATHERVVIADEDVRYHVTSLSRLVALLDQADVVRPQNYFDPLPWHARWDSGRILLNRMTGGDWPGTLGVRLSIIQATGGYDGDVLFENLELVRTIRAAGGRELLVPDLFVLRRPPSARHFWSQRVRQAYDEFARPLRLIVSLALLPLALIFSLHRCWRGLLMAFTTIICVAEMGRRRDTGESVFPFTASLLAPFWVMERAICIWLALGMRVFFGGVPYHGTILRHAATSETVLRQRYAEQTSKNSKTPLRFAESGFGKEREKY